MRFLCRPHHQAEDVAMRLALAERAGQLRLELAGVGYWGLLVSRENGGVQSPFAVFAKFLTRMAMHEATVAQFMQRYHVDEAQARRVAQLALNLYQRLTEDDKADVPDLNWAAQLHEIGISVAYGGYHKHSAYIAANADMPGFTREEQNHIARLLLTHRRSLKKLPPEVEPALDWIKVFALRLAVLFCQRRTNNNPRILSAKAPRQAQLVARIGF